MATARQIISVQQARQAARAGLSAADVMRQQAQMVQARRQAEIVSRLRITDDVRAAALGVQMQECSGILLVEGAGEVNPPPEVNFPVAFIEKPVISGGWELVENQALETGNFPTSSVGVVRWITHSPDNVRTYWLGAALGIVSTGRVDQLLYIHWQMRGKALRNPIGDSQEVQ